MGRRNPTLFAALLALASPALPETPPSPAAADFRARLPEDEIIYFVLPDRFDNGDPRNDKGGYGGDRLTHGYDPAAKGFYHGGDLKGLTRRLDYIQGLGATAIWVGPIFRNKPVQGAKVRKARAITAIGSPTSPMSTRIWAPTPISRRSWRRHTHAA